MKPEKAVAVAIDNVLKEGLTDIFERPFEVDLLKNPPFRTVVTNACIKRLKANSLEGLLLHPIQHVLFPKKDPFDFRRAALIEPMDTITTLALAILVAQEVEKSRPEKRKKKVFSYRYKPQDGFIFDPAYNFTAFNKHVSQKAKSTKFKVLVKCDIASFYDRLNIHRLESTLHSLLSDSTRVKLVNEVLLYWAKRDSYGLPIGGNASRIFAEAALISVDEFLISNKVNFCRFVDDYRFFAPTTEKAHAWLTLFVERLYREGLTINPSKTVLEDITNRGQRSTAGDAQSNDAIQGEDDSKQLTPNRIIIGYSGIVPTKFRKISEKETAELAAESLDSHLEVIRNTVLVKPEQFRKILKLIVAQKKLSLLSEIIDLLDKFPQFTPLYVDVAIKYSSFLDLGARAKICEALFSKANTSENVPEYILISIVKLLGAKGFERKDELVSLFRQLRRNSGAFVGRSIIDALNGLCTRSDALEIREYFDRADAWEKRSIIRIVDTHLPEAEKRPWLKNVAVHHKSDVFAIECFRPLKNKTA